LKIRHLLLAISITALWGLNFSVIKLENSLYTDDKPFVGLLGPVTPDNAH